MPLPGEISTRSNIVGAPPTKTASGDGETSSRPSTPATVLLLTINEAVMPLYSAVTTS